MLWPWNPGQRSLTVIRTDTDRSATYYFQLTLHTNHEHISYRFRDKRQFLSKITIFSHPCVFNAPAEGVPLGVRYGRKGSKKLEWWGYQMVEEVFKIGLADQTQYRHVTVIRPSRHATTAKTSLMHIVARVRNVTEAPKLAVRLSILRVTLHTNSRIRRSKVTRWISDLGGSPSHHLLEAGAYCGSLLHSFLCATRSIERISYGNVAGWLADCHSRYCIKTTKPILKLFRPCGSPII